MTAYEQIQLYNQSYEWNPVTPHSPSTASSSVQINTDLSSTTNQSDADGISNTSNSAYDVNKPIATTSVDVSPIHVTETFTQNGVAQIGGTSGPSQINTGQSVIVRLLTNLRDVLLIFLQILRSRPTYGYEAPWAPKGAASVYR